MSDIRIYIDEDMPGVYDVIQVTMDNLDDVKAFAKDAKKVMFIDKLDWELVAYDIIEEEHVGEPGVLVSYQVENTDYDMTFVVLIGDYLGRYIGSFDGTGKLYRYYSSLYVPREKEKLFTIAEIHNNLDAAIHNIGKD